MPTKARPQLLPDKGKPHRRVANKKEERKKQNSIAKEVEELLFDSPSWRVLQAKRWAQEELRKYADEGGQRDLENLDVWQAANAEYRHLNKGITAAEIGAAASGIIGAAGIGGFWYENQPKTVGETMAKRRSVWGLGTAGILGLLGAALALHRRRRLKKKRQLIERRLVRMENEAYAGVIPSLKPVLGVDEISKEELRRRKKQEEQQRH